MNVVRFSAVLLLLAAVAFVVGTEPSVADDPPYAENEGPVYFVVSFDDTFVTDHPKESETIVTNIGSLLGGQDVGDTRFVTNEALMGIVLPDGRKDPTFDELSNNAATVFGSFYALDEQGFHTAVPVPGEVAPEIQEAVFLASNGGVIDQLIIDEEFPTTEDIAEAIEDFLPPGSPYDKFDIYDHIFGSAIQLAATEGAAGGEGEIFPYEPNSESLYIFTIQFNADEEIDQDFKLEIPIDIQSPINVESKTGELPVHVGDTEVFKATDVVPASVTIGGVYASRWQLNGNGELVMKFDVPALVAAGALTTSTTELTILGELTDGSAITGTDAVTVSSNND